MIRVFKTTCEIISDMIKIIYTGYKSSWKKEKNYIAKPYYTESEIEVLQTYKDIKNVPRVIFKDDEMPDDQQI